MSTRAGTGRQRYCAHEPSSSAPKVLGCGKPFAIRQLGSTTDDPSVHHNTRGSYIDDNRCDSNCSKIGASCAAEPIGICHGCALFADHRRRGRVEHHSRRKGDRRRAHSPSSTTRSSKRSKSTSSAASVSMSRRSALSKKGAASVAAAIRLTSPGQLGDERQREIASDAIDARHHQPDDRCGTAGPRRADEAPGRAREIDVEPALAEGRTACRQAFPQPGVPRVDERVRHAPAQEIAVARQLAEQPYFHWPAH